MIETKPGPSPSSILSRDTPPDRPGPLATSVAFAWRAMLKIKHVPEQLGDVIGIPVLFTLLFTYLFGGAIAGSASEYLQYLLPGTLVLAILLVTIYAGVTLNTDTSTGVLDRYRSMRIWRPAVLVGGMIGDIGRYLIAAALVLGLGLLMGFRPPGGPTGVLASVALILVFAFGMGWVWTTIGLVLRSPSSVLNGGFLVLIPLTFASNIFVAPATMPGWLAAFVDVNPVSHLTTAVREMMQGTYSLGSIAGPAVFAIALVVVFAPLTMYRYRRLG